MKHSQKPDVMLFEPAVGPGVLEVRLDETDQIDRVRYVRPFAFVWLLLLPFPILSGCIAFWSPSWLSTLIAALCAAVWVVLLYLSARPMVINIGPETRASMQHSIDLGRVPFPGSTVADAKFGSGR